MVTTTLQKRKPIMHKSIRNKMDTRNIVKIQNTPVETFINKIHETAMLMEDDGYNAYEILIACEEVNKHGTKPLHAALKNYYNKHHIKTEYIPAIPYLKIIRNTINDLDTRLKQE